MHISVLLAEVLALFASKKLTIFVDATCGAGGHSAAIHAQHPEIKQLICFDQDQSALELAKGKLSSVATMCHSNFCHIAEKLAQMGIDKVDGLLFDLGLSSMQLDQAERGFSFQRQGPLDMRQDRTQNLTAEDIVNSWPEVDLANTIYELGEERASRKIAKAIVQARRKERITSCEKLAQIIESVHPRYGRLHPATKTFQALRMAVNRELEVLQSGLEQAFRLLAPGAILVVISFHSLEDRIVKQAFKALSKEAFQILTKKPLVASREECQANPRSRSAKLRALQAL